MSQAIYDDEKSDEQKVGSSANRVQGNSNRYFEPNALNKAENSPATNPTSANNTESSRNISSPLRSKGGFWSGGSSGTRANTRSIRGFVSSSLGGRGKFIAGGAGGVILIIVLAFGAFVPYEIVHLEKVMLGYETKVEAKFEKKAAQKMMQKIVDRARGKTPAERQSDAETESANGEELASEMDKIDLTSPTIEANLAKVGIQVKVDPTTGALEELTDENGNDITDKIATDPVVADNLETALPEWDVGEIEELRPLTVDQAGGDFSGFTEDIKASDVDKTVDDKIANGASQDDLTAAAAEEDEHPPAGSTATETQIADEGIQASGEVESAIQAADAEAAKGGTEADAIKAGSSAFNGADPLLISSVATTACSVKNSADSASKSRTPTIMKLLERHATLLISLADELKTGHLNGGALNKFMQLLNGNSSSKAGSQDSLPINASQGYQNAIGNTGGGVPIEETSKPSATAGNAIVGDIDGVVNKVPGANLSCSVLTSSFGGIVQGIMGVVQFLGDDASFGAGQAGVLAGGTAFNLAIQNFVIPDIIKYFAPVGLNGLENSVQWGNNSDAGLNGVVNNYSRRIGAPAVSSSTADSLYAQANVQQNAQYSRLPLSQRLFALEDPNSLVSRIVDNLPMSVSATVFNFRSFLTNLPSSIVHGLASIFSPHAFAQAPTNPGQPYNITQYAFGQVDTYDQIANEQYLFSKVTYNGQSVQRINALGNPNNYKDTPQGDTNNSDLLHCYVDSFAIIEAANSSFNASTPPEADPGADQNCGAQGMYDITTAPPNSTDMPNDQTAATIYCAVMGFDFSDQGCISSLTTSGQLNDEVGHFQQYLLDTHVMGDYMSLTNNQ